ncbi:response regulator transcription factor [Rhodocytophaga rosea]|uniref:Response regulator transcription factor n=1 Tax=Rhodocytophaga rosea TaxID=2704465 RepID=A0A6C0GQY4_9BACT|nr:LytTR family DNA-binding domain-containing protein [Rhodocytophaga rosea]QHT70479.1 response regulator transcription factor [Rhodocytophaga rosea]
MTLRVIAIDDEPLALEVIKTYVARFPSLQLVQTFDDALFAAEFLKQSPVDLLFVDIQMPDISGLDLVRSLPDKPIIIFTTAHKKFAFEGFELEALDYLLKPIDFERFSRAVHKAIDYYQYKHAPSTQTPESLFVHAEYKLVKINLAEVEYIESLEDYIRFHLAGAKPIMTLMPLKKVLDKLPPDQFKRIHRSYVVRIDQVKSILNRKVTLISGKELPISDSYSNFIKEWIVR